MTLNENDFPSVYLSADKASVEAQSNYLRLIKIDLFLMIIAAFLTTFNIEDILIKRWVNGIAAFLFAVAFILSLILRYNRFEKTWYGGRAVAESVKSLTWKFITKTKPFNTPTEEKAIAKFLELLREISSEKNDLAFTFEVNNFAMITDKMKVIRTWSVNERLKMYNQERIAAQRNWYSRKSQYNKKRGNIYSIVALVSQLIGLAVVIYLVIEPNSINFTGAISSITVALFSWMQIKKFQELSQAYSLTANELGMAEAESVSISTDKELSDFVNDSESAISREHTMWSARRE